jgi:hypothetical protein
MISLLPQAEIVSHDLHINSCATETSLGGECSISLGIIGESETVAQELEDVSGSHPFVEASADTMDWEPVPGLTEALEAEPMEIVVNGMFYLCIFFCLVSSSCNSLINIHY